MQERLNPEMLVEQAKDIAREIRKSEAYPAILGGIAGGIAGALMASSIASRFAPRPEPPAAEPQAERGHSGFDIRQAVELLVVVAGLVKQAREWYSQERRRKE